MAESKFSGIFQRGHTPEATTEPQPERIEKAPAKRAARPVGRPPGKRSDPEWKQFSVLLKLRTQREATAILREKDEGLDLSGLIENLLNSWIKKQKA